MTEDRAAADAIEIARLAGLSSLEYDREREAASERLGCRVSTLDHLVAAARGEKGGNGTGQGRPIELSKIEPWPDPVDGADLLDEMAIKLREYVILFDAQADAVALWDIHTHCFEAAETSPKLVVKSAQKRSGKSRLIEVLERTAANPLYASGIKPAALLRIIEMHAPTLLLDEVDTLMKQDREMAEALRGLINSGFSRAGARFVMNVPVADGGYEPREFSTWTPLALSGIGNLPDTVRDRSIEIEMKRKLPSESVKRLRRRDGDDLHLLARKTARWANDNMTALQNAQPEIPSGLHDRAGDAWEPLLAIADLVGGRWPQRARSAALMLSGNDTTDDANTLTMLLSDLHELFDAEPSGVLFSREIVDGLVAREDRPWAEYGRTGKPITTNQVATLLRKLKVPTNQTMRRGSRTDKGYCREDLDELFARYLAPRPVTRSHSRGSKAFEGNGTVTSEPDVTDPGLERTRDSSSCDCVTDRELVPADGRHHEHHRGSDLWGIDI